jgi:hypothetical protein
MFEETEKLHYIVIICWNKRDHYIHFALDIWKIRVTRAMQSSNIKTNKLCCLSSLVNYTHQAAALVVI